MKCRIGGIVNAFFWLVGGRGIRNAVSVLSAGRDGLSTILAYWAFIHTRDVWALSWTLFLGITAISTNASTHDPKKNLHDGTIFFFFGSELLNYKAEKHPTIWTNLGSEGGDGDELNGGGKEEMQWLKM